MPTSTPASPPRLERTSAARRPASVRARADWVDVAKGIGILLVVVGHAIDGLLKAELVAPDGAWAGSFYALYSFHMPLFFVLAGLFVAQRVAADADGFVRDAFVRIAWPYLLWSVIQLLVIDAVGGAVNTPHEVGAWRLLSLLWEPTSQFWFLQALLLLHLLGRALLPRIGAAGLLLVLLGARGVVELLELPVLLAMPARFGVFYALGIVAAPWLLRAAPQLPRPQASRLAAAAALAWAGGALAAFAGGQGHWSLAALPAALAGSALVIALALWLRGPLADWGLALGRASMAIYLLHVLFVAGTRIALHKGLGIDAPLAILVAACAAGIAGPLLLRQLALRAHATRALGLG